MLRDGLCLQIRCEFRKVRPSSERLRRFGVRARRLYEREGDIGRLRRYVTRWVQWLWGGLDGLVSLKGGYKRYMILILKELRIRGVHLPG